MPSLPSGGGFGKFKLPSAGGKGKRKYTPSLVSIEFGITKPRKAKLPKMFTGLEIRPLLGKRRRGFRI